MQRDLVGLQMICCMLNLWTSGPLCVVLSGNFVILQNLYLVQYLYLLWPYYHTVA